MADTLLAHIAPLAQRKGLNFRIDIDAAAPARVVGDSLRLGQVLFNLCSNSVKFTEQGEIALEVRLLHADAAAATLLFSVRDTGIGLAPQQSEKLFAAFSQADASSTRKVGGSGLGLVICQRLASMMGGRIWVKSALGEGSTFFFEAAFGLADDAPQRKGRLSGTQVVLVDADVASRRLTGELLAQEGARVHAAGDADAAVSAVQGLHGADAAVILLALEIGEADGYAALRRIRTAGPRGPLPLIVMSSQAAPGMRERCLAEGAQDLLARPVAPELLVCTILSWRAATGRADLPALLGHFSATLAKVQRGLSALGPRAAPQQARQLAPGKRPVLAPEQVPLVRELINCLRRKDTHADQLIAQLKDELGTPAGDASTWLQAVAAEVDALDYDGALDLLSQLGWNEA